MTSVAPAPLRELGYTRSDESWWQEESAPELQWPLSVAVFDRMRRTDSQVGAVLRAVTLPVVRTPWRVDGTGCRPEVTELVATDLGLPIAGLTDTALAPRRTKDRFSWTEHLRLALLMLPLGHAYFEQVYRLDEQGRARLRKLAYRPASTISEFNVAPDGGLISIRQHGWALPGMPADITIPVDRLVAYVSEREGANWYGNSLLRTCYKDWLIKDRLLRVQAQTIERNGMGVPIYEAAETETDLRAGQALAQAYRSGDNAGAAIAHGAKLTLTGVTGTLPDAGGPIRYHDEAIARAVLAHFLNLGQATGTGSYALATSLGDFFTLSLQALAQQVADVATAHVVEDLVDLNFGPSEPAPRLVFDEIGSRQDASALAIKALVDAGVLYPDRVLEEAVRQAMGLPAKAPAPGSPSSTDTGTAA